MAQIHLFLNLSNKFIALIQPEHVKILYPTHLLTILIKKADVRIKSSLLDPFLPIFAEAERLHW